MIRSKLIKLLKCGMACCVFLSVVAWQTKDTSLQPTDTGGFIVEIQKKYAEVQAIKKKGNQEEIENKIKAVHRRLFLQSTELCALLSLLIPKVFRMPVPNVITLRAARWRS